MKRNKHKRRLGVMNKDKILILLSFVIPVFILAIAYGIKGIYPGGPFTVLILDLKSQYMPFFASLRDICRSSDNSLFINMSGALGNNFMGFAYYIFSPLTWTTVFFPVDILPDVLYAHTLIRIGLCGAAFCYYLICTNPDKKNRLVMFLLSCCYALMSYNVGYSLNIMWLDGVLMLPLILVGVERVLDDNSPIFLVLSVFFSIVLNYYISCMSAFFVFIYLCIRLSELQKWSIKRFFSFIAYALLGIGLSMPFVLPGIIVLINGRMSDNANLFSRVWRYRFTDVLAQLLSGRYDMVYEDGLPLIFCGTFTLLFVLVFFIKSRVDIKIKIMWLLTISFYLFAMCFVPLDNIMNGFVEPNWFEARYSYAFCCMLLILAYRGAECAFEKINKPSYEKVAKTLLTIFVFVELFFNSSILLSGLNVELRYGTRSHYNRILNLKRDLLNSINDDGFYRVSEYEAYTYNDAAWLGYNGFGYFSSCYNPTVMNFFGALGEDQSHHILRDGCRTPLEESLLGAKYRLWRADSRDDGKTLAENGVYVISENESALSLGYMTDLSSKTELNGFIGNAFENQNQMAQDLSGVDENVFVEIPHYQYTSIDDGEHVQHDKFIVDLDKEAMVWLYFEIDKEFSTPYVRADNTYCINGVEIGEFLDPYTESAHILYVEKPSDGEQLEIEFWSSKYKGTMHVAYLDEMVYKDVIDKLGKNQFEIHEHSSGHFCGKIDAGGGGTMLLSLPMMNGWNIKVDGNSIQPDSYREALLKIELPEGQHDVDIRYIPPGFYCGIVVGSLSLAILISVIGVRRHEKT